MRILAPARAVSTAAALLLLSCQSNSTPQGSADLATSLSMLSSSVVSQGCTFTISAVARPGFPPLYDYVVARQASASCAYKPASTIVGSSYSTGAGITGNDNGVAVAFVTKNTPSGSSPLSVNIRQINVITLATVRSAWHGCGPVGPIVPSTYLADLFMLNGTTLQVNGSKGCSPLAGLSEFGSGGNYYAYYFDFFTTTNAPVIIAY